MELALAEGAAVILERLVRHTPPPKECKSGDPQARHDSDYQDDAGHVHGNEPVVPAAHNSPPDLTASDLAPYFA
jgi:hypothetical protein